MCDWLRFCYLWIERRSESSDKPPGLALVAQPVFPVLFLMGDILLVWRLQYQLLCLGLYIAVFTGHYKSLMQRKPC